MKRNPGDPINIRSTLLALFSDIVEDRNYERRFKSGHQVIHRFFWELSQNGEKKTFVSDLLFDTNGTYPHAEEIDELFQELQLSGLLSRPNPTYKFNDITFQKLSYASELKKELSPDEIKVYNNILEDFKKKVCVPIIAC